MKIGIVRHFKVNCKFNKYMNSSDFEKYVADYDRADVIANEIAIDESEWTRCYCSDLPRAIKTAKSFYSNELEVTDLLREVKMYPVRKINIKIPSFIWSITSRMAWKLNGTSQLETSAETRQRAKEFLEKLNFDDNENIIIVSHGFFLITLINELKLLGFKGEIPKRMKNGYLYILENK